MLTKLHGLNDRVYSSNLFNADVYTVIVETRPDYDCFLKEDGKN